MVIKFMPHLYSLIKNTFIETRDVTSFSAAPTGVVTGLLVVSGIRHDIQYWFASGHTRTNDEQRTNHCWYLPNLSDS